MSDNDTRAARERIAELNHAISDDQREVSEKIERMRARLKDDEVTILDEHYRRLRPLIREKEALVGLLVSINMATPPTIIG